MENRTPSTRRQFLTRTGLAAGAVTLARPRPGWTASTATLRVGVIGCGGRGTGAAKNCVESSPGVKIVALADAFADRMKEPSKAFEVPENRCFVGLDSYRELLALDDVDLVILATPPGFRPAHLTAAVERDKHVFMEKPVAVCPSGIRKVMEAGKRAAEKRLAVVAGTQRRHDPKYVETIRRIHDGAIGDIVSAQCYWNQGALWVKKREPGQSDIEWQLRNWLYFRWLSGDHICEQHVHNIDVINWAFGTLPDTVHSIGGRQYRTAPEYGDIWDHFGTEFIYPNDVRTMSMCRQIEGTHPLVAERVVGTKGASDCAGTITGENAWKYSGPTPNPYVQEHADLIRSIRDAQPLNETQRIAESTLCAIMARESSYSRQQFRRDWFLARCSLDLMPPDGLKMSDPKPVDPAPVPGKYTLPGLERTSEEGKPKGKGKGKGKSRKA